MSCRFTNRNLDADALGRLVAVVVGHTAREATITMRSEHDAWVMLAIGIRAHFSPGVETPADTPMFFACGLSACGCSALATHPVHALTMLAIDHDLSIDAQALNEALRARAITDSPVIAISFMTPDPDPDDTVH
jgi:hypothetical protein